MIAAADARARPRPADGGGAPAASAPALPPRFEAVYEAHFDFVWRVARRLGVPEGSVDDVVQDVFLVVHRRLAEFEGRSALASWLFAITRRVVHDHRRSARRKSDRCQELPAELADGGQPGPREAAARAEAVRILHGLLDQLADDRREVFVLAELEQMTAPEIAEALEVNVNTVYSRLRAARQDFEQALARRQAGERHRGRPRP